MASKSQQRKEKQSSFANRLAVATFCTLAISLVFTIGWPIYQKRNYDKELGRIESSLRLLTATVAPQLLKAVDENLMAVLNEPATQPLLASQALAKIENDTASLRKLKANLPAQEVSKTSALLEKAVDLHSDNTDAWRAAAQMVSYRSELRIAPTNRPDCYKAQGPGKWDGAKLVRYHDCTLDISNVAEFFAVEPRIIPKGKTFSEGTRYLITVELVNGTVSYSGGQMIQIERLLCQNCSFDLQSPDAVPPPAGRALSQQLLVADLHDVSLTLPPT